MAKKILEFIPKSNKWLKFNKIIPFNIAGTFDFVIVKNLFSLFFKAKTRITSILFFKSKSRFKSVNIKLPLQTHLYFKTHNKSKISFKVKLKSFVLLFLNFRQSASVQNIAKPVLKLIALLKINTIKNISKLNLNLLMTFKSIVNKFNLKNSTLLQIGLDINTHNTTMIQSKSTFMSSFFANNKNRSKILANNKSIANMTMDVKLFNNKSKFKSKAKALVYRPIKISTLYPNKISDWYSHSIEDIFFGEEIV